MSKAVVSVTMELALEGSANYAGGLGVLEADKFYAAGSLGLNYVVVAPLYPYGYVDWEVFNKGRYAEVRHRHTLSFLSKLNYMGTIESKRADGKLLAEADVFEYRHGSARALLYRVRRPLRAARLFRYLYRHHNDECTYYIVAAALSSEIVGKILKAESVLVVDVQEAHLALLPYLLPKDVRVRFVTHTPGPWGHPKLCKESEEVLGISLPNVKTMTEAIMEVAEKVFAVSRKHLEVTKSAFPKYAEKMAYVTNGVNLERWQRVREEPGSPEKLWALHVEMKRQFASMIKALSGKDVGDRLLVAWVRRLAAYKRPYFVEWLIEEGNDLRDRLFIVVSGKPHPSDEWGKSMAQTFSKLSRALNNIYFYPSYSVDFAYYALSGSDLLLFTPLSCWEASGTSMMKAGVNGVPTLSSRDGASLEMISDGVNGWFFGRELTEIIAPGTPEAQKVDEDDFEDFLKKLAVIVELYEEDKPKYAEVAYSAYKTFAVSADVRRALKQYYPELIGGKAAGGEGGPQ